MQSWGKFGWLWIVLATALAAVVLSACQATPDPLIDRSLATGEPCAAPCWQGLHIGKSSLANITTVLQQLPFVDADSIQQFSAGAVDVSGETQVQVDWHCLHPRLRWCGSALLTGDRLEHLRMMVNFPWTLADAVQRLGQPSYVGYDDYGPGGQCYISLYWADKGVSIRGAGLLKPCPTPAEAERRLGPNPNIRVISVTYTSPTAFHFDQSFPEYHVPWRQFSEGPLDFLDFVPGNSGMWLMGLGSLVILLLLAVWLPKLPAVVLAFPLAAIAVFAPTLQFQFSDVCIPTIVAFAFNTTLCGFGYTAAAQVARAAWRAATRNRAPFGDSP